MLIDEITDTMNTEPNSDLPSDSNCKKMIEIHQIIDHYELFDKINEGGFSKVYDAIDIKSESHVAIKMVNKNFLARTRTTQYFLREVEMFKNINHPNIVPFIDFVENSDTFGLVLELEPNGELFEEIIKNKYFSENMARKYFQELIYAVAYLHSHDIVHRDIKAENILIGKNKELKLCDLGLARYIYEKGNFGNKKAIFMSLAGSLDYMAPEVITSNGYKGCACDIWSMGVFLFFMLCGYLPFTLKNQKEQEIKDNILNGKYNKNDNHLSKEAANLISHMLEVDPKKRYRIEDILYNDWFSINLSKKIQNDIENYMLEKKSYSCSCF